MILDRYVLTLFAFQGHMKKESYDFLYGLCAELPFPDVQIIITKRGAKTEDPFYSVHGFYVASTALAT